MYFIGYHRDFKLVSKGKLGQIGCNLLIKSTLLLLAKIMTVKHLTTLYCL